MPHTLLLADDSVTIQRVIELTFADEDVKVVAVSDGDQAIARLESQPPDIVLADVGMPGKNGYEVAQFIKRSPRLSHIPVVLLTGAFEPVDQARAAEAGCDGVLAKPFEPQLVIGRVKELLGHPKQTSPAPPVAPAAAPPSPPPPAPVAAAAAAPDDTQDLANYFDRLDAAFGNVSATGQPANADQTGELPRATAAPPGDIDWFSSAPTAADVPAMPSVADQIAAAPLAATEPMEMPLTYASPASAFDPEADAPQVHEAPASLVTAAPEPTAVADTAPPLEVHAPAVPASAWLAAEAESSIASAPPVAAPAPPMEAAAPAAPATSAEAAPAASAAPAALEAVEAPAAARLPDKPVSLPPLADAFAALLAAERGDTPTTVAWPPTIAPPPAPQLSTDAIVEQVTSRVLDEIGARIDATVRGAVVERVSELAERLIREEIERIKAAIK